MPDLQILQIFNNFNYFRLISDLTFFKTLVSDKFISNEVGDVFFFV